MNYLLRISVKRSAWIARFPSSVFYLLQSDVILWHPLTSIVMFRKMKQSIWVLLLIALFQPTTLFASSSEELTTAALERTTYQVIYDGSYHAIKYPGGDVPSNIGVCTDVIIRSYRKLGIDLQELVHIDMKRNFSKYPSKRIWGLGKPDPNIDHRRVPNLQVFLSRHGLEFEVTTNPKNYAPGDIVTWMLPGNLPHIGIVTDQYNRITNNPMIVHNIGRGPKLEDMLFNYPITGHYRYLP